MQKPWRIVAGTVVILAVAYFIWPTPWATGVVGGDSVRTNRFSGCTFTMTKSGWVRTDMRDICMTDLERQTAREASELMIEEAKWLAGQSKKYEAGKASILAKLQDSRLSINSFEKTATAEIYNSSPCTIKSVTISLNGRKYKSKSYTIYGEAKDISPNSPGEREFEIFKPEEGLNEWYFEDIDYGSFPEFGSLRVSDPTCLGD